MPTIPPVALDSVDLKLRQLLESTESRIGQPSNMLRTLAQSPAILDAYIQFNRAIDRSKMSSRLRGLLTVAIAHLMGCEYVLSIAVALGQREGIPIEDLEAARHGFARNPKELAALQFAIRAVEKHRGISPSSVNVLEQVGYNQEEIVEIIGVIALNLFRNYFNLIAGTGPDFPVVRLSDRLGVAGQK